MTKPSYYSLHRSEILERWKLYYESHRDVVLKRNEDRRASHIELSRKREIVYFRRWRDSHRDKHRAIRLAQQTVPLGSCCEFCGSVGDLMRFHPDYDFPKVVVTVCRECRGWVRCSMVVV